MKPSVYIETTIPSYYCDNRREIQLHITRTRQWWDLEKKDYVCYISPIVLEELLDGNFPTQKQCLELIENVSMLEITPRIIEVAELYQHQKLMPQLPVRDAYHVAVASYYRMDYLLTWNCRHLANANKIPHLESLNQKLGLHIPILTTPEMLQPWEDAL